MTDRMPWQQVEGACRGCGRVDCSLVKQHKSEAAYQACLERTIVRMERLQPPLDMLRRATRYLAARGAIHGRDFADQHKTFTWEDAFLAEWNVREPAPNLSEADLILLRARVARDELSRLRTGFKAITKSDFEAAWTRAGCGGIGSHRDYIDGRAWPWFYDDPLGFIDRFSGQGHEALGVELVRLATL